MADIAITKTALPHSVSGLNITDLSMQSVITGNVGTYTWATDDIVLITAPASSTMQCQFVIPTISPITNYGGTVTSPQKVFSSDEHPVTFLFRLNPLFVQNNGTVRIATVQDNVTMAVLDL